MVKGYDMIKSALIQIWDTKIKESFEAGKIVYERQLQAFLFLFLTNWNYEKNLNYEFWVEPVWYQVNKSTKRDNVVAKPDLVVTRENKIVAIIEIKWTPWAYAFSDINKLKSYMNREYDSKKLILKAKPVNQSWGINNIEENVPRFDKAADCLMVFIVGGRPDSIALKNPHGHEMLNFLQLTAQINDDGVEIRSFT